MNSKPAMHLLMIEDDDALSSGLAEALASDGVSIAIARDLAAGRDALRATLAAPASPEFDLVVLDLMLPDGTGYDLLRSIRLSAPDLPVLILSARAGEIDRVRGLELGADDFVAKPFSIRELLARINAVLRRSKRAAAAPKPAAITAFRHEKLAVDFASRAVTIDGSAIKLSFTEFELLATLVRNANIVLERETLLETVWKGVYVDTRSVDPHVSRLRRKLAPYGELIETVPNVGYKFIDGAVK